VPGGFAVEKTFPYLPNSFRVFDWLDRHAVVPPATLSLATLART
jgi:hypothetical protein